MSKLTSKYQLPYFQESDYTSAVLEMQRFETLDAQLYGLFSIMGNGVIDGWEFSTNSGLSMGVTPGSGHVAFVSVESTEISLLSLSPQSWNYIYAVLDITSYWTKKVNFAAYVSPVEMDSHLYLGKIQTDANEVIADSIDTSERTELGFLALIQSLVAAHRHIGGTDNPSPIDLSSEVQNVLGIDNLPDLDASKIQTGTIDPDRLPLIDHKTKLTGVGSLTHSQLDSIVEQLSITNQKLMGEVSTVNLLQLILALKHVYPDIDDFLVNEIAFIPGISPDEYIDTENTTAIVDTRPYTEGGQHTITGTPSAGAQAYTKVWDSENDFEDSTNSNVYITGDSVSLATNEDTSVIEDFPASPSTSGWTLVTQDNSSIPSNMSLDGEDYVEPKSYSTTPYSGKLTIGSENVEVRLLIKKNFDAQDWSGYRYLKFYIKTESVEHGDLFFYFQDAYYGAQNSYIKVLNRNAPTINIDTLENGWQEVLIDLNAYTRTEINEIGFYVSTADGWDTSKDFDLNIDNISLTSGNIYKEDGYINFIYGNDFPYTFWKVRWDAIIPDDGESTGVSLQARWRMANTVSGLSTAIWSSYTSTSGTEISTTSLYKYIEIEFYFTASTSLIRSPTLKRAYLDYYASDVDNSFTYSKKSDWDSGTLFNIDTITVANAITVSSTEDIDTYFYGTDSNVYQLDSDLTELYKIVGPMLPISTYQALNNISPSLGLITGVSRGNNGNLWLSDIDNDRIIEVDKSGSLVRGFYGSFITAPIDPYGEEEMGPGSNVVQTVETSIESTETEFEVLHSIYNPDNGILYVVFNMNLENVYDPSTSLNLSKIYIKVGSHKIFLNDATVELLGVNSEKYSLWHEASNSVSDFTSLLSQFSFKSHILKFTINGAERTLLDYLLNQSNPSVVISSPMEGEKVTSSITLKLITNDVDLSSDKLRITLDGLLYQITQQKNISISGLSSGNHTIKVEVLNSSSVLYSNIEATANMSFVVEGNYIYPIVYFTSPRPNQIFSSNPVTINFAVKNFTVIPAGQHIKYVVDSEEPVDYFSTDPIVINDLTSGKHTVRIYTVDENGDQLVYAYGDDTVEFIVGLNSNALPILYVESEAIKNSSNQYNIVSQSKYISASNITLNNIYSPIDVQVVPEDDSQNEVTVLVSKLRSPSWHNGLAGEENAIEMALRIGNAVSFITTANVSGQTTNATLSGIATKSLIYSTKYLDGHSVVQLDMNGNTVFSNNAAVFAEDKDEAKNILGSAEKIGSNELLIADSNRKRAIIVNTDLDTQRSEVVWQYDSDRYVSDFHLVNQDEITINISDGQISETELFIRAGTTVIWQNNSSVPVSIHSGYTTYETFEADPDLGLYGSAFESGTLQPGELYTFKFNTESSYDWFAYPSILTAKITITNRRLSGRDQYLMLENDGLESPFSSRVIKIDSWGNVLWSFGESYLVKPRDARPLLDDGILIST